MLDSKGHYRSTWRRCYLTVNQAMFFNRNIIKSILSRSLSFKFIKLSQMFHTNQNTTSHTDLGCKYLMCLNNPQGQIFCFNYTISRKPKVSIKKGFAPEAQGQKARFQTPHYPCCTRCLGLKGWSGF